MSIWQKFKSKFETPAKRSTLQRAEADTHHVGEEKKSEVRSRAAVKEDGESAEKRHPLQKHTVASAVKRSIVRFPIVTEKSRDKERIHQYTFQVARDANKIEIKQALRVVFGVIPRDVRILRYTGKAIRWNRLRGRQVDWKKAVVTMPAGSVLKSSTEGKESSH